MGSGEAGKLEPVRMDPVVVHLGARAAYCKKRDFGGALPRIAWSSQDAQKGPILGPATCGTSAALV
jgi:hypothetical protein